MASGIVDGKFVAYPTLFPDTEGDNGQYGSDPMWWKEEKGIDAFNEDGIANTLNIVDMLIIPRHSAIDPEDK